MIFKQYMYNLGVWLSQTISVWLGGHPDMSVSQRTGIAYLKSPNGYFKYQRLFIDFFMYHIFNEENHCLASLQGESNAKEVWVWGKE